MLNNEQKEFILKNHKSKSVRQIARSLGASRQDVYTFIKESQKIQPRNSILSKHKKILIPFAILILFIIHITLRYNTFWLSHIPGDQNQYTGLAMKLQNFGMEGYSLRGIDLMPADQENHIFSLSLSEDDEGSLIRGLKMSGAGYYDIPFFHKGPAFPIALMISHQIFRHNKDYLLVQSHLGKQVFTTKPREFFSAQFYAAIVPLFFSAVLMILTFYLGKILFSYRIGFYAAFMMAINPISILTSHKLWADDMLAAFVTLSVVFFLIAQKKQSAWISFFAGVSCGIAVLAKQTGILISGAVLLYSVFINIDKIKNIKKWPSLIFDKHLISFGLGLAMISAPWFYKVYSVYGDPLYLPVNLDIDKTDTTGWFSILNARPHPLKLFALGIPFMSPAFVFAYGTIKNLIATLWTSLKKQNQEGRAIVILWFWLLTFALFFILYGGGKEHRRMLPAYPAIALLSSYFLSKLRIFMEKLFQNEIAADILNLAILIACAFWSVPKGLSVVLENRALILAPF